LHFLPVLKHTLHPVRAEVLSSAVIAWHKYCLTSPQGNNTLFFTMIDERITFNPDVMGGKACIRGMRVTVSMVVTLVARGHSRTEILDAYPYLTDEDITAALKYAAFRVEERDEPLAV